MLYTVLRVTATLECAVSQSASQPASEATSQPAVDSLPCRQTQTRPQQRPLLLRSSIAPVAAPAPHAQRLGTHLMRFLEVMRGTLMAAPTRLLPVTKMPLHHHMNRTTQHQHGTALLRAVHGLAHKARLLACLPRSPCSSQDGRPNAQRHPRHCPEVG